MKDLDSHRGLGVPHLQQEGPQEGDLAVDQPVDLAVDQARAVRLAKTTANSARGS
jgi:hypothetical protein